MRGLFSFLGDDLMFITTAEMQIQMFIVLQVFRHIFQYFLYTVTVTSMTIYAVKFTVAQALSNRLTVRSLCDRIAVKSMVNRLTLYRLIVGRPTVKRSTVAILMVGTSMMWLKLNKTIAGRSIENRLIVRHMADRHMVNSLTI